MEDYTEEIEDEMEEEEEAEDLPVVPQLIKWAYTENIAEELDDETLREIGRHAYEDFVEDESSHAEWVDKNKRWVDLAMLVKEEKSFPWGNCANVVYPLLNEAATQFNARAMPALLPGQMVAKAQTTGQDPNGMKQARAERISKHMSYQLLEEMKGWRQSMDRGLMVLPVSGSFFKKTYWNFQHRRPESDIVWPQNLIVNDQYSDLDIEDVPCISEPFELFTNQVVEKMRTGQWIECDLNEDEDDSTEDSCEFVEQHRWIDLDGDGYKEPYIVIFHKDSQKVVRIVARYDEECIFINYAGQLVTVGKILREVEKENQRRQLAFQQAMAIASQVMMAGGQVPLIQTPEMLEPPDFSGYEVAKIQAESSYIKYYFMPSIDGSFYEMGLGEVVESISDTVNTTINQMLDANTLANLQGGLKAKEAKVPAGNLRVAPGEYKDVDTKGMPLRDAFLPYNFKGPSPQSFSLLQFLVDSGKSITSVTDIMVGDQDPNAPATTALINQEEGAKVFNAVYQRLYGSLKKELRNIYHLNRKFLDEEKYINVLDDGEAIKRSDYTYDETDVQPVADPKVSTLAQSIAEAQLLMQFVQDPDFDSTEIKRRYLEAARVTNIEAVMPPKDPNAPPPPEYMMQMQAMQQQLQKAQAEIEKIQSEAFKNMVDAGKTQVETQETMVDMNKTVAETNKIERETNDTGREAGMA